MCARRRNRTPRLPILRLRADDRTGCRCWSGGSSESWVSSSSRNSQLVLVQYGVPDVWPEFFDYVERRIQRELLAPSLSCLRPGAIGGWVIQGRDPRGRTVADGFRKVDLRSAAIGAGDDQAAEGVPGAIEESAMPFGEVPWVLFEGHWQQVLRKGIAHGLVDKNVPVVLRVGECTVIELGNAALCLGDSSQKTDRNEGGIVEAVIYHQIEFSPGIERSHHDICADRAIVGNDVQNPL